MKKNPFTMFLTLATIVGLAFGAYAGDNPKAFSGTITLTNTVTSGTDSFDIYAAGVVQRDIVKVEIDHQSGSGTGTVTVALIGLGGVAETVDASGGLAEAEAYLNYPINTTTVSDTAYVVTTTPTVYTVPQYATTNAVLMYTSTQWVGTTGGTAIVAGIVTNYYDGPDITYIVNLETNYYDVAATEAVTETRTVELGRYSGKKLSVSVAQPSHSTINTYKYTIYTE